MKRQMKDSEFCPFHSYVSAALVAGALQIAGTPAGMSPRSSVIADQWSHFRLKKLKFRIMPATAGQADRAVGWVGGVQDVLPATLSDVMELLPATLQSVNSTHPSDWVTVPTVDLSGTLPWYKAVAGAADTTEEIPGYICLAGTTTQTVVLELKGVFEFKTAVAAANSPEELRLRALIREVRINHIRDRERAKLLTALSSPLVSK